jgi:hypothetical protein
MCPYVVAFILRFVLNSSPGLSIYFTISLGIMWISHGLTLFVYITFNKVFKQVLFGYIKNIKTKFL